MHARFIATATSYSMYMEIPLACTCARIEDFSKSLPASLCRAIDMADGAQNGSRKPDLQKGKGWNVIVKLMRTYSNPR